MKVVVTGGAGFIGSHVVEALIQRGAAVTVLDDLSTGSLTNLSAVQEHVDFVHGDVCDRSQLSTLFRQATAIVHLAAVSSVPKAQADEQRCLVVNVEGTRWVAEAAIAAGVPQLVFASSAAVYGDSAAPLPRTEDTPLEPHSVYALSKAQAEQYLHTLGKKMMSFKTTSLRLFNVFGPRQSVDSSYAAAIPTFIRQAVQGKASTIHGDGAQTRDFVFVADVAAAVMASLADRSGHSGEAYNVASGVPTSVAELATQIYHLLEQSPALEYTSSRTADVRASWADISQAAAVLGWQPRTTLPEGLIQTIAWHQEQHTTQP